MQDLAISDWDAVLHGQAVLANDPFQPVVVHNTGWPTKKKKGARMRVYLLLDSGVEQ